MGFFKKSLTKEEWMQFILILKETADNSRFPECDNYIQHGNTTVKKHCINVAKTAYYLAHRLGLQVNDRDLIRGSLLHDYFLYDWHENNLRNKIHGFTHPKKALTEASRDFQLSAIEENMILHHMFPLTPCPPRYKEGWLLCLADKICATRETLQRK